MKQYIISIRIVLLMAVLAGMVVSCKKMDDYKKYAEGGEIVYPATFDSLRVIPGNYRVMITGFLAGIPNVTKFRVYWNDGLDSLESSIIRKGKVDTIRQVIANLPEGPKTFIIRTYDDIGNRSIPMTITGNVYGANFQKSVDERGNRGILSSIVNTNGAAEISWANVDAYVGVRGMHIHYFDLHDQEYDFIEPMKGKDQVTTLPDINLYKPITYNTLYLPDTVGIDTFTVPVKKLTFTEITLLNSVYPVANRANDGNRWATPRDWTLNAAAMNQKDSKGVYYGGTSIGDKKIYFEAGWGAAAISNGKIYQVVTLAPGNYSFEGDIDWWSVGSKNDTYLTVALGANGLPDVGNISNAYSYKRVDNGSKVITTFTLAQQTTLSLGLVLDLADDGEAMRFNGLRLYIK